MVDFKITVVDLSYIQEGEMEKMNVKVVYHSGRSGNTRKVAEAIAESFHIRAERIGKEKIDFTAPVDLLFVGDGIYFHKPHRKTRAFLQGMNPEIVKNAAAFGTYGNQLEIGVLITALLREQQISIAGEPFTCKGDSPGTDNKGHPDAMDLENARRFAQKVAASLKERGEK